jgi:hypothetical protein
MRIGGRAPQAKRICPKKPIIFDQDGEGASTRIARARAMQHKAAQACPGRKSGNYGSILVSGLMDQIGS